MVFKILIMALVCFLSGCKTSGNSDSKGKEVNVKENRFALQEYILVLDNPEKLKNAKKVMSESYGELEHIDRGYYRFKAVFLQNELKPYLMTQKDLEDYSSGQ